MKKTLLPILALAAALLLTGCLRYLPDGFDEKQVGQNAEQAITMMNERDFAGLIALFSEEKRTELTGERFEDQFGAELDRCGTFEQFEDAQMMGWQNEETGEELGVMQAMAVYENGKLMHALYFNKNSELEAYTIGVVEE